MTSNSIDILSCYDLNNTDSSRFTRVRVCVPLYDLDMVLSADMWPKGVTVRPWVFKTCNKDSTDNAHLRHGYDDALTHSLSNIVSFLIHSLTVDHLNIFSQLSWI